MADNLTKESFDLFSSNIQAFAEFFFPHLVNIKSAPFQEEIYKDLSRSHGFSAYEVFRGGGKSTIGLIIKPIHFALFKPIGDISLISKSEQFVLNEITRKIKMEFMENKTLIACFGDLVTEKWAESYFVLKNGIAFEGCGIGGQLRGGRRGLVVLDDLEDEETALSEEQRDKLKRRVNKELIPKLLPNAEMVYFGTPIHQLCYLHQIIQTPHNGWHKRVYPAYKNDQQVDGNEQWAGMFPHKRLSQIKATMGSNYFSAEYLCNPIAGENVPIKEDHIRYWTELPEQYSAVIATDPAFSEDISDDYKVAVLVAIDQKGNRYLLHYIRTHAPSGEFIDSVLNLFLRHKQVITGLGLPHGAGDTEFFNSFMRKADERNIHPPIQELKNTFKDKTGAGRRNKTARITASLQPLFEQGKYYISPSHQEAREEILTIGQSRWDDLIDAMAYAEQILQPVYFDMKEYQESVEDQEKEPRGTTGYGDGL